jgi:hypothetical protein
MSYRIGSGVDFHQLEKGRELWVGGVRIPHNKGASGHSDADVLLHAICDALLGALSLGDIGIHFPNNSAEFKNIASSILLQRTMALVGNGRPATNSSGAHSYRKSWAVNRNSDSFCGGAPVRRTSTDNCINISTCRIHSI